MKKVTYYPRNVVASDRLGLSTETESITLLKEVPTILKDEDVSWLEKNDSEFKLCSEQKIIIIEDVVEAGGETKKKTQPTPPPPSTDVSTTTTKFTTTTIK